MLLTARMIGPIGLKALEIICMCRLLTQTHSAHRLCGIVGVQRPVQKLLALSELLLLRIQLRGIATSACKKHKQSILQSPVQSFQFSPPERDQPVLLLHLLWR